MFRYLIVLLLPIVGLCDQPAVPAPQVTPVAGLNCKPGAIYPACPNIVKNAIVDSEEWFIKNVTSGAAKLTEASQGYNLCCDACSRTPDCKAVNTIWQPVVGTDRACNPPQSVYYVTCMLYRKRKTTTSIGLSAIGLSNAYSYISYTGRQPPSPPFRPPPPPACPSGDYNRNQCPGVTRSNQAATGRVLSSKTSDGVRLTSSQSSINFCCSSCKKDCIGFNVQVVAVSQDTSCFPAQNILYVNCTYFSTVRSITASPTIFKYPNVFFSPDKGLEPDFPSPPPSPPPCRAESLYQTCGTNVLLGSVAVPLDKSIVIQTVVSVQEKITKAIDGYGFCCQQCTLTPGCTVFNIKWTDTTAVDSFCSPPQTVYYVSCELIALGTATIEVVPSASVIPEFENAYGQFQLIP